MKRHYLMITMLMILGTIPILALAEITGPPPAFVADHPAAFSWVLGLSLLAVCVLLGMKLQNDSKNNERQWHFISKNSDDITDIRETLASMIGKPNLKKRGDG